MLDMEKLIDVVQERPALYDHTDKEYLDRYKKAKYWSEVAKEMYDDWDDITPAQRNNREKFIMKKWKALRDNFVRECRVMLENGTLKKRKYIFYDKLAFLTPYVKHSEKAALHNALSDNEEGQGEERMLSSLWDELSGSNLEGDQSTVLVVQEDTGEPPRKRGRPRKSTQEISSVSSSLIHEMQEDGQGLREECVDRYGNRAFLLSYQPIMDALPQQSQLHVRMLITQVFYELQNQVTQPKAD